jgi:uncharacterized protein (TIGR02594 family)
MPNAFVPSPNDPAWLKVAAGELGQREVPGPGDNPRIVSYFEACSYRAEHDAVPWCSAFVNWCLRETHVRRTQSALAASWLRWGQECFTPQRGAIVVLRRRVLGADTATGSSTGHHVGFYLADDRETVTLLGGNQHDAVTVARFPRETYRVLALRWPRASDRLTIA